MLRTWTPAWWQRLGEFLTQRVAERLTKNPQQRWTDSVVDFGRELAGAFAS